MGSGNDHNFVGAAKELVQALKEMDQEVKLFLKTHGTDWIVWKRNLPAVSHMRDVWDKQIRSARSILSALLITHGKNLGDESLRILMAEAEAVIILRRSQLKPFRNITSPLSLLPLDLVTRKSNVTMPPPGSTWKI